MQKFKKLNDNNKIQKLIYTNLVDKIYDKCEHITSIDRKKI